MGPQRIQLSRAKGWRMPLGAVKVDRTTRWGNPFNLKAPEHCWTAVAHGFRGDPAGRQACSVALFEAWILRGAEAEVSECGLYTEKDGESVPIAVGPTIKVGAPPSLDDLRAELGGKDLACWCKPGQPCHAEVLLRLANEGHKISGTAGYGQLAQPSVALKEAAAVGDASATIEPSPSHAEPCQRRDGGTQTDGYGQLGQRAKRLK